MCLTEHLFPLLLGVCMACFGLSDKSVSWNCPLLRAGSLKAMSLFWGLPLSNEWAMQEVQTLSYGAIPAPDFLMDGLSPFMVTRLQFIFPLGSTPFPSFLNRNQSQEHSSVNCLHINFQCGVCLSGNLI
jgi:hypothetical protein